MVGRPILGSGDPTKTPSCLPVGGAIARGWTSSMSMAKASSRLSVSDLFGRGELEQAGTMALLLVGAIGGCVVGLELKGGRRLKEDLNLGDEGRKKTI